MRMQVAIRWASLSVSVLLLCAASFLHCSGEAPARSSVLRYPGNGLPFFSKNREITQLAEELLLYSHRFPSFEQRKGRILFHGTQSFSFTSTTPLVGPDYSLRINLGLDCGGCRISIGNLEYLVSSKDVAVRQDGKELLSNLDARVRSISLTCFGKNNSSTTLESDTTTIATITTAVTTPAVIRVDIAPGSSGYLGPWLWLRGYE